MLASDIGIQSFSANGTDLEVAYSVGGDSEAPFDIGIYRSDDGTTLGTLLTTHRVLNAVDRQPGDHVATIEADFSDVRQDYFLVAVVDSASELVETDESNNTLRMAGGVFRALDGVVHVHGSDASDSVDVTIGATANVTYNGSLYSFETSAVASLHIRTHEGDDSATAATAVTQTLWLFGGAGEDTLGAGSGNDYLCGGTGDDQLTGAQGDDTYGFGGTLSLGLDAITEANGGGTDTLDFFELDFGVGVHVDLGTTSSAYQVIESEGRILELSLGGFVENVIGTNYRDIIIGNVADNRLEGRGGHDVLIGLGNATDYSPTTGLGGDQLFGGDGNDMLIGDAPQNGVTLYSGSYGGDLNGDGFVDALDIDLLWNRIRHGVDDPGHNDSEDLNRDGLVNEDDVDYMLANLLTAGTGRQYGDADLDGGVGGLDYSAWRERAGTGWVHGDFDGDGGVGGLDYSLWRTRPTEYPGQVGPHDDGIGGGDFLSGDAGNDVLEGGAGDDVLSGSDGDDIYKFSGDGSLGSDMIDESTDAGIDMLDFSRLSGGAGVYFDLGIGDYVPQAANSQLTVMFSSGLGIENVNGTEYADGITGNELANTIYGRAGEDWIEGKGGNDTLQGGDDGDVILGGSGDDMIAGGSGNDWLYGTDGACGCVDDNDHLCGGEGDDFLFGEGGDDHLSGGPGNDMLDGGGQAGDEYSEEEECCSPPTIVNFTVIHEAGLWTFTGMVIDDQEVAGLVVRFGDLLAGYTVVVEADGTFWFSIETTFGAGGTVTAQTTDREGCDSNTPVQYVT